MSAGRRVIATVCLLAGVALLLQRDPPGPLRATAVLFDLAPRPVWALLFLAAGVMGLATLGRVGLLLMVVALAGWALGLTAAMFTGDSTAWHAPIWPGGFAVLLIRYAGAARRTE